MSALTCSPAPFQISPLTSSFSTSLVEMGIYLSWTEEIEVWRWAKYLETKRLLESSGLGGRGMGARIRLHALLGDDDGMLSGGGRGGSPSTHPGLVLGKVMDHSTQ